MILYLAKIYYRIERYVSLTLLNIRLNTRRSIIELKELYSQIIHKMITTQEDLL